MTEQPKPQGVTLALGQGTYSLAPYQTPAPPKEHLPGLCDFAAADREVKHDVLAGQLLVDGAERVQLVLSRVAVLRVQVHLRSVLAGQQLARAAHMRHCQSDAVAVHHAHSARVW